MPLPASCAVCIFHERAEKSLCRRRAPNPGDEEFVIAHWPIVKPSDRCGSGWTPREKKKRQKKDEPAKIQCEVCQHWWQPNGKPVKPDFRGTKPQTWWDEAGYCTRHAPSPSEEEDRRVFWRVVHRLSGCGDGDRIPDPDENPDDDVDSEPPSEAGCSSPALA